jgi:hypothetical protein
VSRILNVEVSQRNDLLLWVLEERFTRNNKEAKYIGNSGVVRENNSEESRHFWDLVEMCPLKTIS